MRGIKGLEKAGDFSIIMSPQEVFKHQETSVDAFFCEKKPWAVPTGAAGSIG